jgi:hypothetical protein
VIRIRSILRFSSAPVAVRVSDLPDLRDNDRTATHPFATTRRAQPNMRGRYALGDDGTNDVVIERVRDPDPDLLYPICLDGARADAASENIQGRRPAP